MHEFKLKIASLLVAVASSVNIIPADVSDAQKELLENPA